MSKHSSQSISQTLDPASQKYIEMIRGRAQEFGNQGFQPYDPKAELPYAQNYMTAMAPMWDKLRALSVNAADERATNAGAFGGSRTGVAEGTALADIAGQEGMAAFGAGHERAYQEFLRQQNFNPQILAMLEGAIGPTGGSTTQDMTSNPWMQLLGMGLGFAAGGPAGATVGSQFGGGGGGQGVK